MTTKALIRAQGYGKMLRPLTCNLAKSLVPVGGRTLIGRLFDLLSASGVSECCVMLDEESGEVARAHPPGSAGPLDLRYFSGLSPVPVDAALRLSESPEAVVALVPGDLVAAIDLAEALAAHRASGADLTVVCARVDEPFRYGAVISGADGRVSQILDRPAWGEVFSDRVSTGLFLVRGRLLAEPGLPSGTDLRLPRALLERGAHVRAFASDGYFRALEGVEDYLRIHRDILAGVAPFPLEGKASSGKGYELVAGKGCKISKKAKLSGRVALGAGVTVGDGAMLTDAALGDGCSVGERADVRESVLASGVSVGPGASVGGAAVGAGARILAGATLKPLCCVADGCTVGEGATVLARVKVWPHQEIAAGATVSQSVLWGDRFRHALFTGPVVTGMGNVDLTPETAVRLGAAFGATLGPGATVSLSRDPHPVCRLVVHALALGLNSVGITVYHLKALPLPVAKCQMRLFGDRLGLHVRMSPLEPNVVDVRPFEPDGSDLAPARRKEVEARFFADDGNRAMPEAIGQIVYPHRVHEQYRSGLFRALDAKALRSCRARVAVDVGGGAARPALDAAFSGTGISLVTLDGPPDPSRLTKSRAAFGRGFEELSETVRRLPADLGALFDAGGEKIFLVDGTGHRLSDDEATLCFARLHALAGLKGTVALPPSAPGAAEAILEGSGIRVRRAVVGFSGRARKAAEGCLFAADGSGGFLFPAFQPAWDAILALAKLLELLERAGTTLARVRESLPACRVARAEVAVEPGRQAAILQRLIAATRNEQVDLTEGVRVVRGGTWALVLPDPEGRRMRVAAEGETLEASEGLCDEFRALLDRFRDEAAEAPPGAGAPLARGKREA